MEYILANLRMEIPLMEELTLGYQVYLVWIVTITLPCRMSIGGRDANFLGSKFIYIILSLQGTKKTPN